MDRGEGGAIDDHTSLGMGFVAVVMHRGGLRLVDWVVQRLTAEPQQVETAWKSRASGMKWVAKIHSARAVRYLVDLHPAKRLGKAPSAWLLQEGADAVVGLHELAAGSDPARAACAKQLLDQYRAAGHGELVDRLTPRAR